MANDSEAPEEESKDEFQQRQEKYAKKSRQQSAPRRRKGKSQEQEEWENLTVGERENNAKQSPPGPSATRIGGKTETFNIPEAASKMTAEQMAELVTNAISQLGMMFAKGDEQAAMNDLEKMLVEIPLQSYLEVPAVAEKVAEHGSLYFIVGGFAIYFMRVTQIRAGHIAEQKTRSIADRMRQTPPIQSQPQQRPGQMTAEDVARMRNPDVPQTDQINAQHSWLGGSRNGFGEEFPIDGLLRNAPPTIQTAPTDIKTEGLYGQS